MKPNLFPKCNQVPPLISEIATESTLEALSPGETAWTVPWMLGVDEEGKVSLNMAAERRDRAGGTVTLKVLRDFDGIYIDATALSRDDLEKYFKHDPNKVVVGGTDEAQPVSGVIYPQIRDAEMAGIDPEAVVTFNREQLSTRTQFKAYYLETYGKEYKFAEQEVR